MYIGVLFDDFFSLLLLNVSSFFRLFKRSSNRDDKKVSKKYCTECIILN